MIRSISSRDHIGLSILTSLALHRCFGPSAPGHHSTCPSHLQPVRRAKSCLNLLHLDHMTQLSCLICNELLHHMCEFCNTSKPFHLHGKDCSHMMYLWTNHLCISFNHTLVHLGCHSITKPNKDLSTDDNMRTQHCGCVIS
jgi:hypothetical protein